MKSLIVIFLFLSITVLSQTYQGKVVGISDGDTVDVFIDMKQIRIRVEAIDCPEKDQAYGKRSKQFTSNFCFGKQVIVTKKEYDKYGRMVARIKVENSDLSEELLKAGMAWHFRKYDKSDYLQLLENKARIQKIGLWADPNPVAPWCFRHPNSNCE